MIFIKDLNIGDEFVGFYLIRELLVKKTNSNPVKDYFDLVLSDSSGQMAAKYWDVNETDKETFLPMHIVKVRGIVQSFKDKPQIRIEQIRKTDDEDGVSIRDFIRSAPIPPEELIHTINQAMNRISDLEIKKIVNFCVKKIEHELMHAPAAKGHHHAYLAGLAYHIVRMLELGEFVSKQRSFLNPDLIYAGIILHDIAKTEEMVSELGIVSDYSVRGKLIGHIAMVSSWITEAAILSNIDLKSERVLALQHIVLSHHNLGEWGSPVQPQIAEAVAVHFIDQLDAKLQMVEDSLSSITESDQWTPVIHGLENKAIYRPQF